MTIYVTIHVKFPKYQFKKIPKHFSKDLSLGYEDTGEILCLGTIVDLESEEYGEIYVALEVRKDETPLWYLKKIISEASSKEILFMKTETVVSREGIITLTQIPQKAKDSDIVYPFWAKLSEG